jgi:hypothetical protein
MANATRSPLTEQPQSSTDEQVDAALPSPLGHRILEVNFAMLAKMLLPHDTDFLKRTTDAPPDLEIVAVFQDPARQNMLLLKVTSADWEPVPEGYMIPRWIPTLTTSIREPDDAVRDLL